MKIDFMIRCNLRPARRRQGKKTLFQGQKRVVVCWTTDFQRQETLN